MTASLRIELAPWRVPNYIVAKMPDRPGQGGFEGPKWLLSETDVATLAAQCDTFRRDAFAKAGFADPLSSAAASYDFPRERIR